MVEQMVGQHDCELDMRRLRGILAEHRITHTHFASVCGLSRTSVSRFLAESHRPGKRARARLALGIQIMGLGGEEHREDAGGVGDMRSEGGSGHAA